MSGTRSVCRVCLCIFTVNLILFGIKLYIGLASNSISIFSDSVNSLFDALSVLLTFTVLEVMIRASDSNTASMAEKGEQLFSFLISVIIVFTGLYFAYSALERFMYPTPVWYIPAYLWTLSATAAVKLILFLFLKKKSRRLSSDVLKLIAFDSLLDFFITSAAVLTLILSGKGNFSFDAVFGLIISAAITVPAVRMLVSSGKALIDYVPVKNRERVNEIIDSGEAAERLKHIKYLRAGGKTEGFAFFSDLDFNAKALCEKVYNETRIKLYAININDKENSYDRN